MVPLPAGGAVVLIGVWLVLVARGICSGACVLSPTLLPGDHNLGSDSPLIVCGVYGCGTLK